MTQFNYLRVSLLLLLAIIPLSVIGYLFAVNEETLFFLYEWSLAIVVSAAIASAIMSVSQKEGKEKWEPVSVAVFLMQFALLGLFLGPLTDHRLFVPFYIISFLSIGVFVLAFNRLKRRRWVPIVFIVLSGIFLLYMVLLNSLWAQEVSIVY